MEELIKLDSVDKYNKLFGLETLHPMVAVVDLSKATVWPEHFKINYGVYALFLKDTKCGDITYGRQPYDYKEGTIVCFAPGQVATIEMLKGTRPTAHGVLFHPDFIRGTMLGQEIKKYSFFSYETSEALHLSETERETIMDCFRKIEAELEHNIDKHSRRLITANIGLLLDYCMRFYERQFTTREVSNKDVVVRFERLLDEYFDSKAPQENGLPSVKYFADKVFLSPNYFGDMISKQTGKTVTEYIQDKLIGRAKELLLSTSKPMSEIAYSLGFQYPQHMSRMFKRIVGITPNLSICYGNICNILDSNYTTNSNNNQLSLPSKINPNPNLPAAFILFFRRIFFMAYAMKILLKKNTAANGLELKERLQGLTATDVTHSRKSKAAILIFHI